MSSIERFVDKLGKAELTASADKKDIAAAYVAPMPQMDDFLLSEPPISRSSREAVIDFQRISELGMLTPNQAKGVLAEEYRAIKRPLLNNILGALATNTARPNLVMVTSALPGEGKSFSSINLAISMASEMDNTVLLVEADVAKPAICQYFGIPEPEVGLVDYLASPGLELADLLLKTNVPKLSLLPAGQRHVHSTELLASESMRSLMGELSQRYSDRIIIFDSPPLLATSEAVVLASLMGQIVLVVEAGKTPQATVKDALALLDPQLAIGVILNKSERGVGTGYDLYSYGNYGGAT
jgi:protein-tyrosine kinase